MVRERRARPLKAKERDRQVLWAARNLFAERGFEATTVADVAAKAGVAVGTVYLRFENKAALLAGVLQQVAEDFVAVMAASAIQARPWRHRLRPLFSSLLAEAQRQSDLPALMALSQHNRVDVGENIVLAWIARFIEDGQAAGAFRPMAVGPAAAMAFGMVQGAMQHMLATGGSAGPYVEALADAAERWVMAEEAS